MSQQVIEVTDDASKIREVVEYLDSLKRSIMTNQKQVRIEHSREGRVIDVKIHLNGRRAGEPAPKQPGENGSDDGVAPGGEVPETPEDQSGEPAATE